MSDGPEERSRTRVFHTALDVLLATLAKSAKTAALYKEGHGTSVQIAERVLELLMKTLGDRTTLVLEVKAKGFVHEELELPGSPESAVMSAALHTLGVGQLLFTNRLTREGVEQFFKILRLKPDGKTTLTDLQKLVQQTRIDGLQMTYILDFVVTGEKEEDNQPPGRLSEEQIQAFVLASSLPDMLTLLLRQNENLHGKEAEEVDSLLSSVLSREAAFEDVEEGMPWPLYDPRIRARLQELAGRAEAKPRTRNALVSWASVVRRADSAPLRDHAAHEKAEAMEWCLRRIHGHLDRPANAHQPKFAVAAYGRIIGDLGTEGRLDVLLREFERLKAMSSDARLAPHWPVLRTCIDERVVGSAFAQRVAERVSGLSPHHPDFERLGELLVFLGAGMMPLLVEQLPRVQEKAHLAGICSLLAAAGRSLGGEALTAALKDPDYFVVVIVAGILAQLGVDDHAAPLAALLKHSHPKVRETAWRALAKSPAKPALDGMLAYAAEADPEEAEKAIIAMSLAPREGLAAGFIAACRRSPHERTQVAVITALGRLPSPATIAFLKEHVRRTWYEVMSGRRKDLCAAAKRSLEALHKDGHA